MKYESISMRYTQYKKLYQPQKVNKKPYILIKNVISINNNSSCNQSSTQFEAQDYSFWHPHSHSIAGRIVEYAFKTRYLSLSKICA